MNYQDYKILYLINVLIQEQYLDLCYNWYNWIIMITDVHVIFIVTVVKKYSVAFQEL